MTPPTTCASQHGPSRCTPTRVLPAVVRQPDRNVHTDALCHKPKPRRDPLFNCLSQQQLTKRPWPRVPKLIFALLCGLLFLCQSVQANLHGSSIFDRELVYDRRPAPQPRMGIYARQDDSSSPTTALVGSSGIPAPSSTSSISQSTIETAASVPTSLPRPFDSNIGNNFTEPSCPEFFNTFLSNTTFQECLPFSMLLQTSSSFFTAMQSPLSLVRVLDATCHIPSYSTCSTLMSALATELSTEACEKDLRLENPLATQAYAGLVSYDTLYAASCLTSPATGNYCYADAVTNTSAPTSSYIYHLPLGMSLPGGTRPACTNCLRDTMAIFASAASSKTGEFRGNYAQAAQVVDLTCGPGFADAGVASSAGTKTGGKSLAVMSLVALVIMLVNVLS